jgi:hypothetical protein
MVEMNAKVPHYPPVLELVIWNITGKLTKLTNKYCMLRTVFASCTDNNWQNKLYELVEMYLGYFFFPFVKWITLLFAMLSRSP